jgi:hypothetical protein
MKARIANFKLDSLAEWGTMSAAPAVAHCRDGLEMALETALPTGVDWPPDWRDVEPIALKDQALTQ